MRHCLNTIDGCSLGYVRLYKYLILLNHKVLVGSMKDMNSSSCRVDAFTS